MNATSLSRHQQDGAALIVVLVLMTLATILSVSGIQSSITHERLAGNQRAVTQAQMNAEKGLTEFQDWLVDAEWKSDTWSDQQNLSQQDYRIIGAPEWKSGRYVTVSAEGLDGGASAIATATFRKPGLPNISADAVFTCFGQDCELIVGAANGNSKKHVAANGNDFEARCVPGNDDKQPINPDGTTKAGVIMPEGSLSYQSSQGSGNKNDKASGIEGGPAIVTEDSGYHQIDGRTAQYLDGNEPSGLRQLHQEMFETLMDLADISQGDRYQSISGEGLHYAGEGSTVSIGKDASGILILEGATLNMTGSACFKGLIIARSSDNGSGSTIAGSGTTTILGAVIGEDFVFDGSGNPSLLYSSEALSFEDSIYNVGNHGVDHRRVALSLCSRPNRTLWQMGRNVQNLQQAV